MDANKPGPAAFAVWLPGERIDRVPTQPGGGQMRKPGGLNVRGWQIMDGSSGYYGTLAWGKQAAVPILGRTMRARQMARMGQRLFLSWDRDIPTNLSPHFWLHLPIVDAECNSSWGLQKICIFD